MYHLQLFVAVAPFPGATTGTGGRIRDVQAAGRGAHVVAGTAGYCFGNLKIPGSVLLICFVIFVKINLTKGSISVEYVLPTRQSYALL